MVNKDKDKCSIILTPNINEKLAINSLTLSCILQYYVGIVFDFMLFDLAQHSTIMTRNPANARVTRDSSACMKAIW